MGFTGFLVGLFHRTGLWDFLKERTKRQHQLKAEEARLKAIDQLTSKLPSGAEVMQAGPDGYFVIRIPGAPPLPIPFGFGTIPPRIDETASPQIEKTTPPEIGPGLGSSAGIDDDGN